MARYSFSGSIPQTLEHKLRRQEQRFPKIATTTVLDKDENLLLSGLQRHRSCHSNEITLLSNLLAAVYLIQLWCQFLQIFVFGDVVYAQTWEALTLKTCIEPP